MWNRVVDAGGVLLATPVAFVVAWAARRTIRVLTRRAMRRAQNATGLWRIRLDRAADGTHTAERRLQRADAAARVFGHYITTLIFAIAGFITLNLVGVEPLVVISGAGFVGVALAFGGQGLIQDMIAGTIALLEDRYSAGDDVVLIVGGREETGVVDLIGAASLRLRSEDGTTRHIGHAKIDTVINRSQLSRPPTARQS